MKKNLTLSLIVGALLLVFVPSPRAAETPATHPVETPAALIPARPGSVDAANARVSATVVAVAPVTTPEPRTWVAMLGGIGLLFGLQRLRRRSAA